jgi:hypothetical protein
VGRVLAHQLFQPGWAGFAGFQGSQAIRVAALVQPGSTCIAAHNRIAWSCRLRGETFAK